MTRSSKTVVELNDLYTIEGIKRFGRALSVADLYNDPVLHATYLDGHPERIAKEVRKLLGLYKLPKNPHLVEFFAGRAPMLSTAFLRFGAEAQYTAVDLHPVPELPFAVLSGSVADPQIFARLGRPIDFAYSSICSIGYLTPGELVAHLALVRDNLAPEGVYVVAPGGYTLNTDQTREPVWQRKDGSSLWFTYDMLVVEETFSGRRVYLEAFADPDFTNVRYVEQTFYTHVPAHLPYMVPGLSLEVVSKDATGKLMRAAQPHDPTDPHLLLAFRRAL